MRKSLSVFSAVFFGLLLVAVLVIFSFGERMEAEAYIAPCDIADSFAEKEITALCESGVFEPATDGAKSYFFPTEPVTREFFAKSLIRFLGVDAERYEKTTPLFSDMEATDAGYECYVKAAVCLGVMPLYDENGGYYFYPTSGMSRQEAAYIAAAMTKTSAVSDKAAGFTDIGETDSVFIASMEKSVALDILIGYDDGTIRPLQTITREELALMLYRIRESNDYKQ